jgi:hypothetical protein
LSVDSSLLVLPASMSKSYYLGFSCVGCEKPIKTFAMSEGRPTPTFSKREMIELHCPWCGRESKYSTDDIQAFEGGRRQ